jgi:hypothetical protein
LAALIKPQFKASIMHRNSAQVWNNTCDEALNETARMIGQRIDFRPIIHRSEGDYHFAFNFLYEQQAEAIAFARMLSMRLPGLWFTIDRYFVKAGVFYRRGRGYKFPLVPAAQVHVRRDIRAAISRNSP